MDLVFLSSLNKEDYVIATYELEGTKNQCIRVIDENGNYIWRRLDELKSSDWISIQKKNRLFGKKFDMPKIPEYRKMFIEFS
jgi:intein/homing endonuclease